MSKKNRYRSDEDEDWDGDYEDRKRDREKAHRPKQKRGCDSSFCDCLFPVVGMSEFCGYCAKELR